MKSLFTVIFAMTIMILFSCQKEIDQEQKSVNGNDSTITNAQKYWITDSTGVQIPAVKLTVNFKWIDSIKAKAMVKLTDNQTGVIYTFQSLSYLPIFQGTLIPKLHTYNLSWYTYNNQGRCPKNTHYTAHLSVLNTVSPLLIDTVQRSATLNNLSFSALDSTGVHWTITGYE